MQTPIEHYPELAEAVGIADLYFKREDLHPYGSHKGRSIPVMIDYYYEKGNRNFVISSSGNAALAAILYAKEMNERNKEAMDLDVYVGKSIPSHKMQRLRDAAGENDEHIRILIKERPLQALTLAVQEGTRSLRQSNDDMALVGYESLAEELSRNSDIGAVFIGTSSGTTAQALAKYFLDKKVGIQVHVIQTSSCHPISDAFENYDGPDEPSIAGAISDITAMRKPALIPLIEETGGYGWVATNDDIGASQKLVKENTGLDISANSALSVVGAMQAAYRGHEYEGAAVCLICGD